MLNLKSGLVKVILIGNHFLLQQLFRMNLNINSYAGLTVVMYITFLHKIVSLFLYNAKSHTDHLLGLLVIGLIMAFDYMSGQFHF